MLLLAVSGLLGLTHAASFSINWASALGGSFAWLGGLLSVASLAGLFTLVLREKATAIRFTIVFCAVFYSAGLAWLYISMNRYGGMPSAMAAAAVVLLAIYLSSFYLVAVKVAASLANNGNTLAHGLLLASCWALADIARGYLFTGFPWLALGYSALDTPLTALAPYSGVYGIGLAMALLASAIAVQRGAALFGMALIGVICAVVPTSTIQLDPTKPQAPLSVALIQGNIAQDIKFDRMRTLNTMASYAQAISRSEAQLIVLPETAWTTPWSYTPEELLAPIKAKAASSTVVVGVPIIENGTLANSMVVIGSDGKPGYRYDKNHLVPFGEFVPWGFDWFVRMMTIPLSNFSSGGTTQPLLKVGDELIAFNICYEDIFGEEIRLAVLQGATVLVNASNIAWFGDSHALHQHLQMARMRALETARPMLRATNTGATAHIAANGEVKGALPFFTANTLNVSVVGATTLTHFVKFGNYPALILCLVVLMAGAAMQRRKRSPVKIKI